MNISLYFRTIRHLKFIQLFNRIIRKIRKPGIRRDDLPAIPAYDKNWTFCNSANVFNGREFTFLNRTARVETAADWNGCSDDKLWLYNLHYFDFLKQTEYRNHPESGRWIERWIQENPPFAGNGWEPYPLSLRIVNWIKWLRNGNAPSPELRESLVLQIRCLEKNLEYHLLANHLMANAKALIFAGAFFSGAEAERWLARGWKIYRAEIREQILDDGAHFERSPMYHSIILEDLLDVYQLTHSRELEAPIRKMLVFLEAMTFPDRRIALFNDAAYAIAPEPDQLFAYAQNLGFPPPAPLLEFTDFPDSGYARVHAGAWDLILDAGPVGPGYQPGHAHADTLSFELHCHGKKLITDTGTSCYKGEERAYQRSTAAHNTVVVDGRNSSEVWSSHRVGRRAAIRQREILENGFRAIHNGYAPIQHARTWRWSQDVLEIEDRLSGSGIHQVELYFHFMPEEKLTRRAAHEFSSTSGVIITLPENGTSELFATELGFEFGKRIEKQTLKFRSELRLPCVFSTRIRLEAEARDSKF